MSDFAEKLSRAREQAGYSQIELSRRLNVSRSTIYDWESGKNMPNHPRLVELAKTLGVTTDYLLGHNPKRVLVVDPRLSEHEADILEAGFYAMQNEMLKRK